MKQPYGIDRDEVLALEDLSVGFVHGGTSTVLAHVSLSIRRGETLGLVGESGCGKSTLGRAVMRLLPSNAAVDGEIRLLGRDVRAMDDREIRRLRGGSVAMIFQNPMSALNPVLTIGRQITEALETHTGLRGRAATARAVELLHLVGIGRPVDRVHDYPHQLSGGMRQRAMIAMAVSCDPKLLIADEPTTALDVTVQTQILDLLAALQEKLSMAILFISHDMAAVASVADRVAVMYAGRIVEQGQATALLLDPAHPYTSGLLNSVPSVDGAKLARLQAIPGNVSAGSAEAAGCSFHPRCRFAVTGCDAEAPPLADIGDGRASRCWLATEDWRPDAAARGLAT
ncbi:ABC transporter ATP-binding protein [Nitratireductor arenosus]|uniref:ABC transporter ATP-binding protein n=1 Tax=Nitratireductor arenosus TaxID=2682096 RepID=UPI0031B57DC5